MRMSLILMFLVFIAGVPLVDAQESKLNETQKSNRIKRFPKADANQDGKLDESALRALREISQARQSNPQGTRGLKDSGQTDANPDR